MNEEISLGACCKNNPKDRLRIDKILDHTFFSLPYPGLCSISTFYEAPKELEENMMQLNVGSPQPVKVATSRAKSVAKFRKVTKSTTKFPEATDEDVAKENLEKDGGNPSIKNVPNLPFIDNECYLNDKMRTYKGLEFNVFSPAKKREYIIEEKPKFMPKMNMASLQTKYHPTNNIDIPKVEISTCVNTPVSSLFSLSVLKLNV